MFTDFKKYGMFNFRKKIAWRLTLRFWLLILLTIIALVVYIIPFQQNVLLERMDNEASDLAVTILHTNSSAFISGELGTVVINLEKIVPESKSIRYVVLTKKDGQSLVYEQNGWRMETLNGPWLPSTKDTAGYITDSKFANERVFHKPFRFIYSGIDWGWIHVGLSLDKYEKTTRENVTNILMMSSIMAIIVLILSIFFAKKITLPIIQLDKTTQLVTNGKYDAKIYIKTGDELENLSNSFNKMTESLIKSYDELEGKVKERTALLEETNDMLLKEIVDRKKIEETLHNSLREKEVLLKEIHHRVKNNLQIINSLLSLQFRKLNSDEYMGVAKDSQNRIKSMALVHEKLYQSKDLSKVEIGDYIKNLANNIRDSLYNKRQEIQLEFDISKIYLSIDIAIPLGLILNELITNSIKYAFDENNSSDKNKSNKITITAKEVDNKIYLEVEDNGKGLESSFHIDNTETLGLKLVYNLSEQIESELVIDNTQGTKFMFQFNKS